MPTSLRDFHVYPGEQALGLARSTLASVRALTGGLPYGPSMLAVGRLASALRSTIAGPLGQLAVARELFGEAPGCARLEAFLAEDPRHLLFSERQFFVLQRLLVDHAAEGYGSFEAPITGAQADTFKRVLLALPTILQDADARLIKKTPMDDDLWLAYTVKHNAYFDWPDWRAAASRSYAILATRARRSTHPLARSIDESIQGYFSPMEEQLAVGFAFAQQARLLESGVRACDRPIVARGIFSGTEVDEGTGVFEHVSSYREQYEVYFRLDGNARGMTWDRLQFMRWPYLRMNAGNVATSPWTALNWLSDSLYHHALAAARNEERQPDFVTWVEALVRDYALDLVESVHLGGSGMQRDTVSDALIERDGDYIVLAICPGRLTRKALVDGDLADLHGELDEKLYEPARRLGNGIRAMLAGDDRPGGEVWPILVTADIAHCELLADRLGAELAVGGHAQVRPLTLLDLEDLELLCALVEHGQPIVSVLRDKVGSGCSRLGLRRFLSQRDRPLPATPAHLVQEDLARLCGVVNALLFPPDEPRALRDASAVSQRQSLLETARVAPLGELVLRLRAERRAEDVPWFDPLEAGTYARILLLHEAADRSIAPARGGSGLVSSDNDDESSEAMWHLLREAGIDRRAGLVTWNIVPWYVDPAVGVTEADVAAAQPWLQQLIYLLYGMSVVVFVGERARESWHLNISRAELLTCPHPSDARPEARAEILATLVRARELTHPRYKG